MTIRDISAACAGDRASESDACLNCRAARCTVARPSYLSKSAPLFVSTQSDIEFHECMACTYVWDRWVALLGGTSDEQVDWPLGPIFLSCVSSFLLLPSYAMCDGPHPTWAPPDIK